MVAGRDPRWVLLVETGEYSTLGRYTEPTEADLIAAEAALTRAGCSGWLAVMSCSVHSPDIPELCMVRPLCEPIVPFEDAVDAFQRRFRQLGAAS